MDNQPTGKDELLLQVDQACPLRGGKHLDSNQESTLLHSAALPLGNVCKPGQLGKSKVGTVGFEPTTSCEALPDVCMPEPLGKNRSPSEFVKPTNQRPLVSLSVAPGCQRSVLISLLSSAFGKSRP